MSMKKRCSGGGGALLFLGICVGFIVIVYLRSEEEAAALQVFVQQGAVAGHQLTTRKGRHILAFEGIPYAAPPTGGLRFRSPQPLDKWEGVLEAKKPGPKCLQRNVNTEKRETSGQEDCLFINVYTPYVRGHRQLAVMVFIHGGRWQDGQGSDYQPHYLLDKDVVLVTFNYRLGALGFLSTGDDACPGNNGLKDQVAALRWVRDNIAAFGGNPNSVTIFGVSTGGASVHYHLLSPASQGLFHRAVSQSGTAFCSWALSPNGSSTHLTERLANLLHCPSQPSSAVVSCLRKKNAVDITAADRADQEWSINTAMPFKPVIETGHEAFLPAHPVELVRNESVVPWMTGITSEEGTLAFADLTKINSIADLDVIFEDTAPVAFSYDTSPRKNEVSKLIKKFYFGDKSISNDTLTSVVNMFTDGWFLRGADQAVSLHAARGAAPIFYYCFTYQGSISYSTLFSNATANYGVSHGDDLIYLFPYGNIFPGSKLTEKDKQVVDIMTTVWTNFARTGNPNLSPDSAVQWRPVSSSQEKDYVQIDSEGLTPKKGLLEERANFWNSLPLKGSPSGSAKNEL